MTTSTISTAPPTEIEPIHEQGAPGLEARRTRVSRELVVRGDRADALWEMYRDAFTPLQTLAVQQHLWSKEEILEELANEKITKFIGWSEGVPVGMCMITNHLELVPMISPAFLRRRFPEHATRNAIFYGIMIFVRAGYRGKTLFARLGTKMAQETALSSGVVLFDMCNFNRENGSLDANLGRLARPFANSAMSLVDQQSWFAVELPEPLAHLIEPAKDRVLR